MQMDKKFFGDKEILTDALFSQGYLTAMYNQAVNNSSNPKVRDEFMNILSEEQRIGLELQDEISKRGWCNMKLAEAEQIKQTKQALTKLFMGL